MAILAPTAAWGNPIATWDYSTGVAAVDFTNLGDYRDLLLWFDGVTNASGATTDLFVRVSTDNGATFQNANYKAGGTTATNRISLTSAVATATPVMGQLNFIDFNAAAHRTKGTIISGLEVSATTAVSRPVMRDVAEANNAIRVANADSSNITAGKMRIYGRRG